MLFRSGSFWLAIREELRDAHTQIFSDLSESSIPNEVTHFTSVTGLDGIISRREIWCTDLRQVSDSRECDYGLDVIRHVIRKKSVPSEFIGYVLRMHDLFGAKVRWTYYISCFCSARKDEPRMWEDYAGGGRGCAIVFDSARLLAGSDGGKSYAFTPVIYSEQIQIERATAIVDHAIGLQRRHELPSRAKTRYWFWEVAYSLMVCGLLFKAPSLQHEQEVRLGLAEHDSLQTFVYDQKTRVAVPFERAAVMRIVRGPNAGPDNTVERIRGMLNGAGYSEQLPVS